MNCFGLSCENGKLSVDLCEEVLEFRGPGVEELGISASIMLRTEDAAESYLGVWHRASLTDFSAEATATLLDPGDLCTHLLFSLSECRGKKGAADDTISLRLFESISCRDVEWTGYEHYRVPNIGNEIHFDKVLDGVEEEAGDELCPFVFRRLGPFKPNMKYAIRISGSLHQPSFGRLVDDKPCLGTRTFPVYGAAEIENKIQFFDLPRLKGRISDAAYGEYIKLFEGHVIKRVLVPKHYSVITVDTWPDRTLAENPGTRLNRSIVNLASAIDKKGVRRHPKLADGEHRLQWYSSRGATTAFMLWLESVASANVGV